MKHTINKIKTYFSVLFLVCEKNEKIIQKFKLPKIRKNGKYYRR